MPIGSSSSTMHAENARLGVETTTRCARTAGSATKYLRCFIGQLAIPARRLPNEVRSFQPKWSKVGGQVQINPGPSLSLDEKRGHVMRVRAASLWPLVEAMPLRMRVMGSNTDEEIE